MLLIEVQGREKEDRTITVGPSLETIASFRQRMRRALAQGSTLDQPMDRFRLFLFRSAGRQSTPSIDKAPRLSEGRREHLESESHVNSPLSARL